VGKISMGIFHMYAERTKVKWMNEKNLPNAFTTGLSTAGTRSHIDKFDSEAFLFLFLEKQMEL